MTTTIHSNGGGLAQPIEKLFQMLEDYTLDRTFEMYGNFIEVADGKAHLFGNFFDYSHVFRIDTDEQELITQLQAAIGANKAKPDYIRQPPPFDKHKVTLQPHRFSVTQGEMSVFYDGVKLGQYGDTITLRSSGHYQGLNERYWLDAAKHILAERHLQSLQLFA